MGAGDRGVDFVTIDGGEGGTGASPPIFADSIALPFRMGFSRVYGTFAEAGLTDDVTFIGSGKLGLPDNAVVAFALGADMVNVAREAMMSIGCIQSQKCHTDRCPTGVATQNPWLAHGLDPPRSRSGARSTSAPSARRWSRSPRPIGVAHPGLITADDIDIFCGDYEARSLRAVYGYKDGWGSLGPDLAEEITELMAPGGSRPETRSIEEGEGEKPNGRIPADRRHLSRVQELRVFGTLPKAPVSLLRRETAAPTTASPAAWSWCGSAGRRRGRRGRPRPSGRRRSRRRSCASPASVGSGPSARRGRPRASGPSCR